MNNHFLLSKTAGFIVLTLTLVSAIIDMFYSHGIRGGMWFSVVSTGWAYLCKSPVKTEGSNDNTTIL